MLTSHEWCYTCGEKLADLAVGPWFRGERADEPEAKAYATFIQAFTGCWRHWGEKGRNSEKARGADLAIRRVLCCTFFNLVTLTVGCGFYFPIQRLAVRLHHLVNAVNRRNIR